MPGGQSNPVGSNGTLNAPGSGGITNAPGYGTWLQQSLDPFHFYPSPTADNSPPSVLPNLGIAPKFYNPNSFAPASNAGGPWNAMAQQLAGPMYRPQLMPVPKTAASGPQTSGSVLQQILAGTRGRSVP